MDSLVPSELAPNLLVGARVELGSDVEIGANVVIHDDVSVGERASVGHGAVLGRIAKLNGGSRRPQPQPAPTLIEQEAIVCPYALVDAGCRIGRGVMVGDHAGIREGAAIEADAVVGYSSVLNRGARVGRRARAQAHCIIGPGVVVEEDAFLAPGVQILTGTMNTMTPRPPGRLGRACQIGAGALILPGVEIGAEAVVGAGAVVTKDVPPGATVRGAPAR